MHKMMQMIMYLINLFNAFVLLVYHDYLIPVT